MMPITRSAGFPAPSSQARGRLPRWAVAACCLAAALACQTAGAADDLAARQARAREDQAALRAQIEALQKRIESSESSHQDASRALQASEQAISDISRELAELDQRQGVLQETLRRLETAHGQQTTALERQQEALADQLRAQYASGLSPWTALLSGRDPQDIGRELAWLAYVTRSRTQALEDLQATLDRLADLQQQTEASRRELETVQTDVRQRRADLQAQQAQRRAVLDKIRVQLKEERGQAKQLQARDARLGNLIKDLDVQIAQAEARRQAALKAEAERRARAQADQARQVREQAERHRQEEAAAAQAATQAAAPDDAPAVRTEPEGGFTGLSKGLPRPVSGAIQGRFGTQRAEGGLWRGVVLRAPAGTPVRAVAAGRVVYAHWLSGFGNLLIIDHGKQYLSVYAYNQSLLRQVGDIVARGDEIAQVGATGGQVEPGLYFELRHQGAPLNPEIWMR